MALLPAALTTTVQKLAGLTISVISPETELKAREYLASVRKAVKDLKASVTELKKPFKKEIEDLDTLSKPLLQRLQERDEETERAILAYRRRVQEETEKANQRAIEKFEKRTDRAAVKAMETGKPIPFIPPPALAAAPAKTVELEGLIQTVVKHKKWRVSIDGVPLVEPGQLRADTAQKYGLAIPLEYFALDTAKVGKVVRAGGSIPGVEVYEEESLSQRVV